MIPDESCASHDCESVTEREFCHDCDDLLELDSTEMEDLELDENVQAQLDDEISNIRTIRRSMIKRSFRWFNIAFLCVCLVAAVLRPMEDKIRRRAQSRTLFSTRNLRKTARRFLGNNNYYQQQQKNSYGAQNDDQNDDQNDVEVDDAVVYYNTTDDEFYNATNATNATYYEEEEYYQPIDDFYTYVGDDDANEMKLFPLEVTDIAGFICASITVILSIGGGIGPGAILVAVYIIVMDFPPKVAIPLSCVTGMGINTFGNIMNYHKRHPLSNRPIIDWDLVLVMEPVILLGAIIGTYVNKILEGKTLVVLLVLLLIVIAHNTLKRARRMHHAEELYIKRVMWAKQKRMNAQALSSSPVYPGSFDNKLAEADPPFVPKIHSMNSSAGSPSGRSPRRASGKSSHLLETSSHSDNKSQGSFNLFINLRKEDAESVKSSLIEEEAAHLPQNKVTYVITMFLFVISMNVLKGGVAFESPLGVTCGSFFFWLFEFATGTWLIMCTCLAGKYLLRRHAIKEAVGFDYVRGDIKWDVRTVVIYPVACLLAGVIAGMFGIGVAVMVGPMLVGIGVNPAVAAATCGCMNFFTSLAATSSYVVLGSIIPDREYAFFLFCLGFCAAFIGSQFVQKAKSHTKIESKKRLERHSYMAYSMGLVVLVSALCMTIEALLDVVNHEFDEDELDGVCMEERIY